MNTRLILATLAAAAITAPTLAQDSSSTSRSRVTSIKATSEKPVGERADTLPGNLADFNHSGTIDVYDIFDYLTAYLANRPECDVNGNGVLEGLDILEFINLWFAAPSASVARAG